MVLPLMPKATAVWLVDNTALTFDQIAEFCGLHPLEVQGVADGEVAVGIVGLDPIANDQLSAEAIKEAEADPSRRLIVSETTIPKPAARAKGPRYTPVARRQDRPNAIAWLVRYHPELTDGQVSKLVGTTKPTINAIRDRTHWNINNIKLEDPVSLGMCSQLDLDTAVTKALQRQRSREAREARKRQRDAAGSTAKGASAAETAAAEPEVERVVLSEPQPREQLWAGAAVSATPAKTEANETPSAEGKTGEDPLAERERVFGPSAAEPTAADSETSDTVDNLEPEERHPDSAV